MLCIGHRGAKGHEPENTLRSIRRGLELGAEWIEIDVYAVEGRLIVIHDDTLDRTTNGRGLVEEHTLEQLRSLDAGKGEKIPFLEEVFELVDRTAGINVELKGKNTARLAAPFLREQLSRGWTADQLLVSSFNHRELAEFKALAPEIRIGALLVALPVDNAALAERLGAFSINPSVDHVDKELVEDAHRRGLKVFVFTVNSPRAIRRMTALGVDGVFSDYPDRVIEERKKSARDGQHEP